LCWPLHRRFHAALTAMPQSMEECVHRWWAGVAPAMLPGVAMIGHLARF
jgi:hypothetical protein